GTTASSLALDEHSSTDMISVNATYHTINFDPTPPAPATPPTPSTTVITGVGAFVWEVANALAVGSNAAGANFLNTQSNPSQRTCTGLLSDPNNTCFTTYYQARLEALNLVPGATAGGVTYANGFNGFKPAGLDSAYEITVVAAFQEQVNSFDTSL